MLQGGQGCQKFRRAEWALILAHLKGRADQNLKKFRKQQGLITVEIRSSAHP